MEAAKDTLDNLVKNTSKTIEDLYPKVKEDIRRLELCRDELSDLLRYSIELRLDVCFILIDLFTSVRACLNSRHIFEKCYHIKNLEGIRVEGYDLICGFEKNKEYSVWTKIGNEIRRKAERAESPQLVKAYNGLSGFYVMITGVMNNIVTTNEERTSRNLTYHYDDDLLKVYEQIIQVQKEGEDKPMKRIMPWMDLHLLIQPFCDIIEYIECSQGSRMPDVDANFNHDDAGFFLLLYQGMAKNFNENEKLHIGLNMALDSVDSIDWFALEEKRLLHVQDYMAEKHPEKEFGKPFSDFVDIFNVSILVRIMYADMASVMNAFLKAGSDVEYPLTLRRLMISKVSALGHLVGYEGVKDKKRI